MVTECPYTNPSELANANSRDVPNPYYFERGDHRADVPEGETNLEQCSAFLFGEMVKDREDMIKGYVEYNETCGLAMVELGRVGERYTLMIGEITFISVYLTISSRLY